MATIMHVIHRSPCELSIDIYVVLEIVFSFQVMKIFIMGIDLTPFFYIYFDKE